MYCISYPKVAVYHFLELIFFSYFFSPFSIQPQLAAETFRTMINYGYQPDLATYNTMIDCCCIVGGFKYACALVSLMIRNGFCPQGVTYTALTKVCLLVFFLLQFVQPFKSVI